ncbi:MAG: acyltransferase family protein [Bacteroidia bacterium]
MQLKFPQLAITRFVAAVGVVIFHYGLNAFPFNEPWLRPLAKEAGIAVSFFFFLSGFILYQVYGERNFTRRNFFVARIARIAPLYLFAFLLTLFGVLILNGEKPWGGSIIFQFFFVQSWTSGHTLSVNYPSWSVSVEVFFYLMFPLILMLIRRVKAMWFIGIAILFWALSIVQYKLVQDFMYDPTSRIAGDFIMYFPLWHLNTFVSGIAVALIFKRIEPTIKAFRFLPMVLFLIGLVGVLIVIGNETFLRPIMHNGMLAPFYGFLVLGLAYDQTVTSRVLAWRGFVFLGDISYGIYLLQCPVWIYLNFLGLDLTTDLGFYVALLVLILVSVLVFIGIENPLRKYIRKRFETKTVEKV